MGVAVIPPQRIRPEGGRVVREVIEDLVDEFSGGFGSPRSWSISEDMGSMRPIVAA